MTFGSLVLLDASGAVSSAAATVSGAASSVSEMTGFMGFMARYSMPIMLVLILVLMYFMMIRPQRKKEKETTKMRSNIQIGDEITTIGGIVGIVTAVREDTIVLETGSDRSKVRFQRWAIQSNNTVHDDNGDATAAAPELK